jgi:hypothetical protein
LAIEDTVDCAHAVSLDRQAELFVFTFVAQGLLSKVDDFGRCCAFGSDWFGLHLRFES